jgi:hypothetical protein
LIKNVLSFNKFLNLKDKTIINKDKDIFTSVVDYYAIARLGKEEKSSDKKIKKVNTAKALRAVKTVKM